jgi:hypothetical protein
LKYIYLALAFLAAFFIAALPAFSGHALRSLSLTESFLLDGKRFLLDKSAGDDLALIRRELMSQGLNIPLEGSASTPHPLFADAAREKTGNAHITIFPLPFGYRVKHELRLESLHGPVDILFGDLVISGKKARNILSESGWKCVTHDGTQHYMTMATRKSGRETQIVFMDEAEGTLLLVRRLDQ